MIEIKITIPIHYIQKRNYYPIDTISLYGYWKIFLEKMKKELIIKEHNFAKPNILSNIEGKVEKVEYYFFIQSFDEYKIKGSSALKLVFEELLSRVYIDCIIVEPFTSFNDKFYESWFKKEYDKNNGRIPYKELMKPTMPSIIEYEAFNEDIQSLLTEFKLHYEVKDFTLVMTKIE